MDLFEHAEETRQQRLALTWSGKNEGTESRKVVLTKLAPQDAPLAEDDDFDQPETASRVDDIAEEPMPEVEMDTYNEVEPEEQPQPVAPKSASIKLTKQGVVTGTVVDELMETVIDTSRPDYVEDIEDVIEEEPPETVVNEEAFDGVEEEALETVVNEEAIDDVEEVEADADKFEEPVLDEAQADAVEDVIDDEDDAVEDVIAAVEVTEDVEEEMEESVSQAVGPEEGATTSMLAINPVELNDEFQDEPLQKKETVKMASPLPENPAPKPLKLARPAVAVIPEPDDDETIMVATAKPKTATSLKLSVPVDTATDILKPKKPVNNTCKLAPETSEIVADSLGGKLRAARELAGLTEFELAEKTRISSEYITALENEAFGNLPLAPIYIKSYLKTLSRQFGLNAEEMIEEYEAKTGNLKAKPAQQEKKEPKPAAEKKPAAPMPKWLNWGLAAAAAVLAILAIAGIMVNKYGFGKMDENALAVISEEHLESTIKDEFLEIRHMDIPQSETAAAND